ncbi:cytochrome c oxidase assembly factor 4 homolog, mitochondrial-like [Tupaia chinensis]|uniref:cytochrome c oxidase assembly factor 4 homolog, mitochondrial-like n=1 Tax=Tupaia chinensis TaxID=246437 RepID=UPI0003C9102E|nr:cytochrome c oxidase assembly factor 4 homolog, mitochondrial-like [Tupaia chinensis]
MSASAPQGHPWARQVKKEDEEEGLLAQLISRSGCAVSHFAMHQDGQRCWPQVRASRDCVSERQARRRDELQRRKEPASARRDNPQPPVPGGWSHRTQHAEQWGKKSCMVEMRTRRYKT